MKYSELLKDPRWQKKRLEIFQRDNWKCQNCGSNKKQLHVHHKKYIQGLLPWEYKNELLVTSCKDCHEEKHEEDSSEWRKKFNKIYNAKAFERFKKEELEMIKKEKENEDFFNNFFMDKT